jgi:beta-N-acetylhexosaminidase
MALITSFLQSQWVEDTLAGLSLRRRIAQLLHVPAWSNRDGAHLDALLHLVQDHGVGGVTFFQGSPRAQLAMTERLQRAAAVPLLISIDAEWGLAMRLSPAPQMPYAMALGAAQAPELTYRLATDLARQCRRMGVHVNFAPTVDLNTEPSNPVIGFRSFGADPTAVQAQARAYAQGLQDRGVIPVIKHFPGHGDTQQDSHLTLPQLPHGHDRLASVELAPFRSMIAAGVSGVMTAHLQVDALDPQPHTPATLSRPIIEGLLRQEMGFQGLIFTDALDMKGITDHYGPAEAAERALAAGNDVLVFCTDVPAALDRIEQAVARGRISEQEIDQHCRRLLAAKLSLGLAQPQLLPQEGLEQALFSPEWDQWCQAVYYRALRPIGAVRPQWDQERVAILPINVEELSDQLGHHQLTLTSRQPSHDEWVFAQAFAPQGVLSGPEALPEPGSLDRLVISLHGLSPKAGLAYGLQPELIDQLRQWVAAYPVTLVLFGRDEALKLLFEGPPPCPCLIAWQDAPQAQQAAAAYLLGMG